ncbi:MAG TPA: aromatic amino acid lyase, partial [Steroidobacteraceae bacterium]|nr:aromatic amino acid lyase [Steroidobacteraceae bacterium]
MSRPARVTGGLRPGALTLAALRIAYASPVEVVLTRADFARVRRSRAVIEGLIARGDTAYGVNTGFGSLASKRISAADLAQLQHNLVLSHAAGTGAPLSDAVVRLV